MRDVATGEMRSPQSRLCMKPLTYSIQGAVSVGVDFLAQTAMGFQQRKKMPQFSMKLFLSSVADVDSKSLTF
jgi:hypothetical protein